MQPTNSLISSALNQIHQWSEPEQNPMTRMFVTRLSELACAVIEISSIIFKVLEIGFLSAKQMTTLASKMALVIFPDSKKLHVYSHQPSLFPSIKAKGKDLCRLIAGFTATVFIGIIFSPEANFKIHLKLELVVDNLAEKNHIKLAAKLQAEMQKAKTKKVRIERFAKLEEAQPGGKKTETEAYAVELRLAELLFPQRQS